MSALDLTCQVAVELVSDYIEGHLDDTEQLRYELHVVLCQPCRVHLDRFQRSIEAVASLAGPGLTPGDRETLLGRFSEIDRG